MPKDAYGTNFLKQLEMTMSFSILLYRYSKQHLQIAKEMWSKSLPKAWEMSTVESTSCLGVRVPAGHKDATPQQRSLASVSLSNTDGFHTRLWQHALSLNVWNCTVLSKNFSREQTVIRHLSWAVRVSIMKA